LTHSPLTDVPAELERIIHPFFLKKNGMLRLEYESSIFHVLETHFPVIPRSREEWVNFENENYFVERSLVIFVRTDVNTNPKIQRIELSPEYLSYLPSSFFSCFRGCSAKHLLSNLLFLLQNYFW
jgi:hypothetical protein